MEESGHNNTTIFSYEDYRSYLIDYFNMRKRLRASFSTRQWCREIGVRSAATLNMVMRGHRHPGSELCGKLVRSFQFNEKEEDYFRTLIAVSKTPVTSPDHKSLVSRLERLAGKTTFHFVDFRKYTVLSNWYYLAVREVLKTYAKLPSAAHLKQRFWPQLTTMQISTCLKDLKVLDLIRCSANGAVRVTEKDVETSNDIASEGVRSYHHQVLDVAKAALDNLSLEDRQFSACVLNIKAEDLSAAKRDLHRFLSDFMERYQHEAGDTTIQLASQLFKLTRDDSRLN